MLTFIRRLSYRDRVLETLGALFVAYPRGRQFSRDFPDLRNRIRSYFEAETPSARAALALGGEMLGSLIGQLDAKAKRDLNAALATLTAEEIERIAGSRTARVRVPRGDAAQMLAEVIAVALFMARRMSEAGTIGESDRARFAETIDALLGEHAP
jgi:hypothetical protein